MSDRRNLVLPAQGLVNLQDELSVFGPPPLAAGEDPTAYEELVARFLVVIRPKDFLERMWTREVIDRTWEALRLRRINAALLTSAMPNGVQEVLGRFIKGPAKYELSEQWAAGNPDAVKQVDSLLADKGVTMDLAVARAFAANIDIFERIAYMLTSNDARRNATLREIERHRACLARALRQESDEIIEAESDYEMPPPPEEATDVIETESDQDEPPPPEEDAA